MRLQRLFGGCLLAVALIAGAACSSRGDDDAVSGESTPPEGPTTPTGGTTASAGSTAPVDTSDATDAPATTAAATTSAPESAMFGTLPSPCGPGEATIAEGQNGDDGVLRLAAANDHENQFVPGLTQEMLDASQAFAAWCNEQGGIQGLQIEVIDMDGHIVEAAAAIEVACEQAFAMVGGGLVLDDQTFPRFNECGMIDFAGYAVTAAKALSTGMVQPIPNPPNTKPIEWLQWGAENYPDAVKRTALIYTDIDTTKNVALQLEESMKAAGWTITTRLEPALGEANWAPFAQQLKDDNITALSVTGEASILALLLKAMDEVDYRPELILQEANFYDTTFLNSAGASGEGVFVRTAYAPFEEANQFPGMRSYLDMMETYKPKGKIAGLGLQATSAHLMFATAANACLDSNDGVLERECVLAAGKEISSWTGGGLHAETNPSSAMPPECGIIMEVRDGRWQRAYPELGSADDNADGWNCRPGSAVEIPGQYGDYELGVDPERP